MAIPQSVLESKDIVFDTQNHPMIQGKMVVGRVIIDNYSLNHMLCQDEGKSELVFKSKLATEMAYYMIENKLVEFTKQKDVSRQQTIVSVRAFLTPDEQVRILRQWKMQK